MATQLTHLPGGWAICPDCNGHGGSSAYLGAFTREDMDEDPEFFEDYMAGRYDRPCPNCNGGKVWIVAVARCTFSQKRELVEARRRCRWAAESRAEMRRESMMLGEC